MRGKLIVIEGTDCSGKETQTKELIKKLLSKKIKVKSFSYPNYSSPTGKIVGGPYLGKKEICEGWFPEGASHVNPKVASLYYAADRLYNIQDIIDLLDDGYNVVLDRYIYSNMAYQAGSFDDKKKREEMYRFLETLEFDLLKLPVADIKIFLHMPTEAAQVLMRGRTSVDQLEQSEEHLKKAERTYAEIALKYDFKTIECAEDEKIRSIEDINTELTEYVIESLKKDSKHLAKKNR